ncbi:winged helix-turn-helix domain-containing protein, partial [Streptomyces sp. NPDC004561]
STSRSGCGIASSTAAIRFRTDWPTQVRGGWPEGAQVSDNTLDQYLTRLRRKLRAAGSELTIATARGIGHRLE